MLKKKTIMIASVLAVGLIGAVGYSASATYEKANVEQEDVVRIIEDKYDGHIKEIELEKDDGKQKYEVEYTKGNREYEVEIDANDGKVIKEEVEVAHQHHANHKDDNREPEKTPKNTNKNNGYISTQKASEIAQQKYPGHIEEVELDDNDGRRIYEIEIETKRGEVELEIDAKTGEIIDVEWHD